MEDSTSSANYKARRNLKVHWGWQLTTVAFLVIIFAVLVGVVISYMFLIKEIDQAKSALVDAFTNRYNAPVPLKYGLTWPQAGNDSTLDYDAAEVLIPLVQRLHDGHEKIHGYQCLWRYWVAEDPSSIPLAMLLRRGDDHVLVFRGTLSDDTYEWLSVNAKYAQQTVDVDGHSFALHAGGWDVAQRVWRSFRKVMYARRITRLWVAGHSLGAGVAEMLPAVQAKFDPEWQGQMQIYCFAPFRAGDPAYRRFVESSTTATVHLIINFPDLVPQLPPATALDYEHPDEPFEYVHCVRPYIINVYAEGIASVHDLYTYWTGIRRRMAVQINEYVVTAQPTVDKIVESPSV